MVIEQKNMSVSTYGQLIKQCESIIEYFRSLCSNVVQQDANVFKAKVLDLFAAYIKDKTIGKYDKEFEQLELHAAALPEDNESRTGLLHLAKVSHTILVGGVVSPKLHSNRHTAHTYTYLCSVHLQFNFYNIYIVNEQMEF